MNKFFEITIALLFFIMLRPSFTWGYSNFLMLQYLLLALLMFKVDLKDKGNIPLFLGFLVALSIIPISKGNNIFGFLSVVFFVFIPFLNKEFGYNVLRIFKIILVVVSSISILVWLLVVVVNVDLPHSVIPPLNSLKSYNYISYTFLVIPMNFTDITSLGRFCCVFDEPGVVGTYSILLLYIDNFRLKKIENIVLLISGLLSFSLFFYVSFLVFWVLKVIIKSKKKRYKLWAVLGILLYIVAIQTVPILNEKIGMRLEYDKDTKTIVGNNRSTEGLNDYIESIRWTNQYLWGDSEQVIEHFSQSASINNAILQYGFVFVVCFFLFFFFYATVRMEGRYKLVMSFILLIFLTLYQRPGFLNSIYLFLFSSVINCYVVEEERQRRARLERVDLIEE